jgi:hypothetical protein
MVNLGYGILKVHLQRIARKGADGVHRLPTTTTVGNCCQGHRFLSRPDVVVQVRSPTQQNLFRLQINNTSSNGRFDPTKGPESLQLNE